MSERKVLSVNPNSWHYRLYRYHRYWVNRFVELVGDKPREPRLNLCNYMRTLFIWAPLTALLVAIVALLAPLWWPFTREGIRETALRLLKRLGEWFSTTLAVALLTLLMVCGVIAIISMVSITVYKDPGKAAHQTGQVAWISALVLVSLSTLAVVSAVVSKRWGAFLKLVWAWIVAKKHKICPLVEVSS